jgi:hypothetical protein
VSRFRADPETVRVGVRRHDDGFLVTIALCDGSGTVVQQGRTAHAAVFRALHAAVRQGFAGVDLDMGRAYNHPWQDA